MPRVFNIVEGFTHFYISCFTLPKNNGRSGYAIYWEGNKTIRFYTEMGGGDCIFYMDIPTTEAWASRTGYPLEQRDDILKFIAEESLRLQCSSPGSYYKIEDKYIAFYQK